MWSLLQSSVAILAAVAPLVNAKPQPVYKRSNATIEERVSDLLGRMSLREKASQLVQGDMRDYLNITDGRVNETGLDWVMEYRSHAIWTGLYAEPEIIKKAAFVAQDYLVNETELGVQHMQSF
jgi:beta-glucosidase